MDANLNADETIDAQACADLLHCSTEKVEDLARSGELPAVKFGRGWIFLRADLLAYLAQRARDEAVRHARVLVARDSGDLDVAQLGALVRRA